MNDKVRRSIRGSKNHEKCSKNVQKVVQNHEKGGQGVEKNEVEKKREILSKQIHAVVCGCPRERGGSAPDKYLRAASASPWVTL